MKLHLEKFSADKKWFGEYLNFAKYLIQYADDVSDKYVCCMLYQTTQFQMPIVMARHWIIAPYHHKKDEEYIYLAILGEDIQSVRSFIVKDVIQNQRRLEIKRVKFHLSTFNEVPEEILECCKNTIDFITKNVKDVSHNAYKDKHSEEYFNLIMS